MVAIMDEIFTTQEVAEILQIDDSSIRRICIDNEIGERKGWGRMLTKPDIAKIRKIRQERGPGRPATPKKPKKTKK